MKLNAIILLSTLLLCSCLKTAKDLEREKLVDSLNMQMQQSQKLVADMTIKLKEFEQRVSHVNGNIENLEHKQQVIDEEKNKTLNEQLEQMRSQLESLTKLVVQQKSQITSLSKEVDETKKFIGDITKGLKNLDKKKTNSVKSEIAKLTKIAESSKYKDAKQGLEQLYTQKLSNADNNKILHALGLIAYKSNDFENSLVYFSKIYTRWPRSSLAPSSLYHIGMSFKKQGEKDAAKQSFEEFEQKYPKSSLLKDVKSQLKNL